MRTGVSLSVTPADLDRLRNLVSDRNAPQKHVWRGRIVLLSAEGVGTNAIMRETGKSKTCVWRWQERFAAEGVDGLLRDKTRPSRIPRLDPAIAERVLALTMEEPTREATHWTGAAMAEASGVSVSSVQRIWRAHGLQPHRVRQFKLSNDPAFVDTVRDIVGLYVDPAAHAGVLAVDEKSQIQALDRTQPGPPRKKGRAGTMTHDYKRNGTTTLFAAMNVLDGTVIGRCMPQHRHQEFLKFLQTINRCTPKHLDIHCIADNYATHKKQEVKDWVAKHPRFHLHFIPTSSSWLNLVERWFGKITAERIRRGTFTSVAELERAIYDYIEHNNANPKPFVWTKSANDIILKVNRGRAALKKPPLVRRDQL